MTTLVDTADDDQLLSVAHFLAELDEDQSAHTELADTPAKVFVAKCEVLMNELQWTTLLNELLSYSQSLFQKAAEKDVESVLLVASNMVSKLPDEESLEASKEICAATVKASSENAALKVRVLFNLFNLSSYSVAKYEVFMNMVRVAASAGLSDMLIPATKRVEAWVKEWDLNSKDSGALFLELANLLKDNKAAHKEAFNFLIKYLATFEDSEGAAASVKEQAVRAAKDFIGSTDLFQTDLLDMKSVSQLANDPKYGSVFQLLSVFLKGTLEDFNALTAKNPQMMNNLGLSHDDCVNKMRLMSLASLGADTASGEIPYSVVQKTLQVDKDDVESWIVKAIGMKLIEAKMDQLRELVIISRCTHRVFGPEQWTELRSRLSAWQKNLGVVCTSMAKSLQEAKASGGEAMSVPM